MASKKHQQMSFDKAMRRKHTHENLKRRETLEGFYRAHFSDVCINNGIIPNGVMTPDIDMFSYASASTFNISNLVKFLSCGYTSLTPEDISFAFNEKNQHDYRAVEIRKQTIDEIESLARIWSSPQVIGYGSMYLSIDHEGNILNEQIIDVLGDEQRWALFVMLDMFYDGYAADDILKELGEPMPTAHELTEFDGSSSLDW